MASMVPYRSVFGIRPTSLFDALDDMMDFAPASSTRAFPMDVEDKGEGYEVKAYLAGVNKDDIDASSMRAASPFPSRLRRRKRTRVRTSCRRSSRPSAPRVASTLRTPRTRACPLGTPTVC